MLICILGQPGKIRPHSPAGFAVLARIGHSVPVLSAVIGFENLSGGMGNCCLCCIHGKYYKQEIYRHTVRPSDQSYGSAKGYGISANRLFGQAHGMVQLLYSVRFNHNSGDAVTAEVCTVEFKKGFLTGFTG